MLMLCSALYASAYDFEVDGIYYNVVSTVDNTCSVVGAIDKDAATIEIPSKVSFNSRELSVIRIGYEAFINHTSLSTVFLPESIIELGSYCFKGCVALQSINIPKSVTKLDGTFENCTALESIEIPDGITSIAGAFEGCLNLSKIQLPETLSSISSGAFRYCSALKEITIPERVSYFDGYIFQGCTSLSKVRLPSKLTKIPESCFRNCRSLSSINLDNIQEINKSAFAGCSALNIIHLPKATKIDENAFAGCSSLKEFGFCVDVNKGGNGRVDHVKSILNNCPLLNKIVVYPPLEVRPYYELMEYGCHEWLNEITITSLELHSEYLSNSFKLTTNYNRPNTYTYKLSLDSLTELTLSSGLKLHVKEGKDGKDTIYDWYFDLQSIPTLNTIICEGEPPSLYYNAGGNSFSTYQYMNTSVYVPDELLDLYKNTKPWIAFWNLKPMSEYSTIVPILEDDTLYRGEVSRYNINGEVVDKSYRGFVIILYSDGTSKKIIQ